MSLKQNKPVELVVYEATMKCINVYENETNFPLISIPNWSIYTDYSLINSKKNNIFKREKERTNHSRSHSWDGR